MKVLDIYSQYPIVLEKGEGMLLYDNKGKEYIDFYSGHGVISIGHAHPEFKKAITEQLNKLPFYSNAFLNPLQDKLAELLGKASGYKNYQLFLSNSGAEANENALKLASFISNRSKVLALKGSFHGRSAAAVAATDNPKIRAPFGNDLKVDFVDFNDIQSLTNFLTTGQYAAFIIEGIQGVNGVWEAPESFWKAARLLCTQTGTLLIVDEVQSGYARSGKFFAHQYHPIVADVITIAKGMGNGFPVGGTIINPSLKLEKGMLGTTFGGGQLACAAAISVLETMERENLYMNAAVQGGFLKSELQKIDGVKSVRGRGLMLGIEFDVPAKSVRQVLINDFGIITGFSGTDILRLLPPLCVTQHHSEYLVNSIIKSIEKVKKEA